MQGLADSFWRAAAYCLHPRVIALSLLPLLIAGVLVFGFMFFFWESAIAGMRATLENWLLIESLLRWLDSLGWQSLRTVLAALLVLALATPVLMVVIFLLVATMLTPFVVQLVAQRRFPALERKRGGDFATSVAWALGQTLLALLALLVALPFCLIPPVALLLPPLIWGWLNYRVFTFDVLAEHASTEERRALLQEHRVPMLVIGIVCGYLGAVPTLIWAISGVSAIIFAPFVVLLAIWLYTLVFAFSTAWFTHYALAALQARREAEPVAESAVVLEA